MDLDDWEVLSDDGFLDFKHEDGMELFSRDLGFDRKGGIVDRKGGGGIVDVNYFICPSPPPPMPMPMPPSSHHRSLPDDSSAPRGRNRIIPVPIQLEPTVGKNPGRELAKVKDIVEVPMIDISVVPLADLDVIKDPNLAVADQVFFKKMKENEFVDMKVDSPRSSSSSRGLKPQIEVGPIQFEDKEEVYEGKDSEFRPSKMGIEEENGKNYVGAEIEDKGCWEGGGLNIWKWRVTGIGALCSLGVAAATVCIFVFSGHQQHKQQDRNQKLRFQIYTDDQRIKHMVHHATRLNQAFTAARVPLPRAQITFGGYYDGL